ncbi:MAG TPA: hypothetical protein VER03_07765, partial [Bryobacteraceae bacterium]|nr:hypothetical protein [Bryobacteraceae bacterium]
SRIVNPTYNAYLKLIPSPNNDPGNTALEPVNNYLASQTPFNWDYKAFAHRMDYQASSTHRFFGRWSWNDFLQDRTDWTYETARGLHSDGLNRRNRGATVDYVWTKSAATMFDFAVSANEFSDGNSRPVATSYKPSQVGLPSYLDTFAGDRTMLPYIDFNGYRDIGDVDGGNDGYPSGNRYRVVNGKVDVFHLRGSHTIRAGVDARGQYLSGAGSPYTSGRFQFTNTYTRKYDTTIEPAADLGHSWASFMLGLPSSATVDRQDSYIMLTPYYGWYVQDNWRVTNTVNLSFGLRMEYELGSTERYNRSVSYFDPTLKLPITDAAQAAYATRPIAELPVSQFSVFGGSVYPGQNGAPRKLNQNEFMFLPRLGIAWQFRPTTVIRAGYGLYFDSWNVMNFNSVDQLGYSRSTGTNFTNDAGVTWLAGDPYNGISPMSDPFPMRSDGTRFNEPVQNGLGSMAKVGGGWDPYTPYDLQRARQQRWRGSVQQEFLNNVVEVAYAGSYSDRNYINQRLNPLAEQYFAKGTVRDTSAQTAMDANVPNPFLLSNFAGLQQTNPVLYQDMSTKGFYTNTNIRRNQLLRAFPQMSGTLSKLSNLGEFKSHALETRFDRRMAKGLLINASYVWSSFRSADFFYNEFDAEPTWRESNNGRPHRFVASGIYEFPLGKGRTFLTEGFFSHLLGGFQTGATYEWQPGALLDFGNVFFYGDLEDIALSGGDRTLDRWFNIDAGFERNAAKVPASYQLRTFPTRVDGVRADSTNVWNINLQRNFVVRERLNVQFRVDALNALNRSQFAGPSTDPLSTNFGRVTSQTSATNRFLQMQLRIRF